MKTFILDEVSDYTQGTIVVACNDLKKFILKCKKEKANQDKLLSDFEKQWIEKNGTPKDNWCDLHFKYEKDIREYRNKIHNQYTDFFDINFKDIHKKITNNKEHYWLIVKEFESNLPEGVHYCGSYCA